MRFGERVRELHQNMGLTQRQLADRMNVSFSYISKVENERLHFGDYPSENFIRNLASELDGDEDELLLLADKVSETMRRRIQERPDDFRRICKLDDRALDHLPSRIE